MLVNSQVIIKPHRDIISKQDKDDLDLAEMLGVSSEFWRSFSKRIKEQGWISPKQRIVLRRAREPFKSRSGGRRGNYQQADYNESDYEIGAYELCVDWAKD